MYTIANLFYGSYWRIEDDAKEAATSTLSNALEADDGMEFNDLLDDLCEKHDARLAMHDDGTVTVYFGQPVTTISEADNDFDEMALLRVMDLDKGVLEEGVKTSVKATLEDVPYYLREKLSSPGFYVAWEKS